MQTFKKTKLITLIKKIIRKKSTEKKTESSNVNEPAQIENTKEETKITSKNRY